MTSKIILSKNLPMFALALSLMGAGAFAVLHSDSSASAQSASPPSETNDTLPEAPALPPGHPGIGASNGDESSAHAVPPVSDESSAPAITWTAPPSWKALPNPSTMRLATYRIPRAAGETEDTDLSVVRAGGSTDANIERWLGQFDQAGKDTRTVLKIRGMTVTIVEVRGTFLGGMSMDNSPARHPNWALLAAIAETPGSPYFFKMTGPAKSVSAARSAFVTLLASLTPTSSP